MTLICELCPDIVKMYNLRTRHDEGERQGFQKFEPEQDKHTDECVRTHYQAAVADDSKAITLHLPSSSAIEFRAV